MTEPNGRKKHGVQREGIEARENATRAQDDHPLEPIAGAEVSMQTRAVRVPDPHAPGNAVCGQEVPRWSLSKELRAECTKKRSANPIRWHQ